MPPMKVSLATRYAFFDERISEYEREEARRIAASLSGKPRDAAPR